MPHPAITPDGHPIVTIAGETIVCERLTMKPGGILINTPDGFKTLEQLTPPPAPLTEPRVSAEVERLRGLLSAARSVLWEIGSDRTKAWRERLQPAEGAITCAIIALASVAGEAVEFEVKVEDRLRGPHLLFRPRGIGLDACPCCFVCGASTRAPNANPYLRNIAAFTNSKEAGEAIVAWFNIHKGGARLDFRPSEPGWIQVKVGSCDAHLPQLEHLEAITGRYGLIRQADIADAIAYRPAASVEVPGFPCPKCNKPTHKIGGEANGCDCGWTNVGTSE